MKPPVFNAACFFPVPILVDAKSSSGCKATIQEVPRYFLVGPSTVGDLEILVDRSSDQNDGVAPMGTLHPYRRIENQGDLARPGQGVRIDCICRQEDRSVPVVRTQLEGRLYLSSTTVPKVWV